MKQMVVLVEVLVMMVVLMKGIDGDAVAVLMVYDKGSTVMMNDDDDTYWWGLWSLIWQRVRWKLHENIDIGKTDLLKE